MRTALALLGYNRPDYFERCAKSLAGNTHFDEVDCFAFLDGGPQSQLTYYLPSIKRFIPRCELHPRDKNLGCGRNAILARQYLFETLKYDNVIVVEDDVVLTKDYIRFLLALADWAQDYSELGIISAFSPILHPPGTKDCRASDVFLGDTNWISYLMPKATWEKLSPDLLEYADRFLQQDYQHRDHKKIREWVTYKLFRSSPEALYNSAIPSEVVLFWQKQVNKFFIGKGATGQDGVTCAMLVRHGLAKLATRVNRCIHIGLHGTHARPYHTGTSHLAKQTCEDVLGDDTITSFTWWKHD